MPRRAVLGWAAIASHLPWLCDGWPWPIRLLTSVLVGACVWWLATPLREPRLGPVRRILRQGEGPWLLFTPRGVFVASLEQALRVGPCGWWLQFGSGDRQVWCWLSAAASDRAGYRRLARALTARWT